VKILLVLRHAKATQELGFADHDRPLLPKGVKAARRMGRLLRGFTLDAVLTSTASRARETAKLALESAGFSGLVIPCKELYLSSVETHLNRLSALDEAVDTALIVGHNPTLEDLLARLTGEPNVLVTAALAVVGLSIGDWQSLGPEARGRLIALFRPSQLKALAHGLD